VILDRVRAEEQLVGYLLVRGAFAGQPRNLCLLRGEHATGAQASLGHAFAGGAQLGPGPVGGGLLILAGVRAGYAFLDYRIASYWLPLFSGLPA
jgi:hypothetical protein